MSHILAIDLNPLEIEFDSEAVRDAAELLFGAPHTPAAEIEERFKAVLQDAVIDAVAQVVRRFEPRIDFTIRVEQPRVPPVQLVKAINTVPF